MKFAKKVNILGTDYIIKRKNYDECLHFTKDGWSGWCSRYKPVICIGNLETFPYIETDTEIIEKVTLRHEIIHAFLNESGLMSSSCSVEAWADCEEMIDWVALQGPKIYKAWKEAGCL
ncbi:MAG: hypothetical protein Q4D45_12985 [Lachnospiraceae bacterium]|nr:hypothetical protein [Lachnospiraceae bacterium]